MPTPQTPPLDSPRPDLRADPAEDRAFPDEGVEAAAAAPPPVSGIDVGPLKSAANDLAAAVGHVVKGRAGSARQMARDAYDQLKGRTAEPLAKADGFVRQKPYAALGVAVVAGMLLAGFRRRR